MLRPASHTTPPAPPFRDARRPDEPPAGSRLPRRWDQLATRDRVVLSLLLRPDRDLPRAG